MELHKLKFPVEKMCKILKVSKRGYYNWLKSEPSKRWLENEMIMMFIHHIFEYSFESYGLPRMKIELEKYGYYVSRPKIARMMNDSNLCVRRTRKFKATTDSKHKYPVAPNVLGQNFNVVQ